MFKRQIIIILLSVSLLFGCERFENQRYMVVKSDEVSSVTVRCYKVLGVPSMCAYINETTRTVRIEDVVTRIIERIVKRQVITEVPVEKIVTQVEIRYINNSKEVNIEEIVVTIIERIKKYVKPTDIIDVATEVIVDETTDYISEAPTPDDKTDVPFISTPVGDIKSQDDSTTTRDDENLSDRSTPNDDNTPEDKTTTGDNTPDDDTTNGDNTQNDDTTNGDNTPDDDTTDGDNTQNENGPEDIKPLINPGDDNNGNNNITVEENYVRLRVIIGPKITATRPSITQPGLSFRIECNIDGNIVHPEIGAYTIFQGYNWRYWGYQGWCQVPEGIADSDITIYVTVNNVKRWCGLTTSDVKVSKFFPDTPTTSSGGDVVAALIKLDPELIPLCNILPVFTEGESTIRYVLEGTPPNVAIGLPVSATDDDGETLEYSLGGTDASSFSIDSNSGQLRTKDPIDYETKNSYSVLVSVSDTKEGKDEITVTIKVTDDNEAPNFTDGTITTRSVAENTPSNEAVGDPVSAEDENDDTLEYGLTGTDASSFGIDSSSGQIRTSVPLNYEDKNSYSVMVVVSDNNGGTDEIDVTINVSDANDAPVFTEGASTTRSVAENLSSSTVVGTPVTAADEDDDTLEYTLAGTDASAFNINSNSGQITTNQSFNYENKDTYSVEVTVSDNNGGTDEIDVTISVTDANDAPVFTEGTNTSRSVAENLSSGAAVGLPITATDEDDDTLQYTLAGTDASSFRINSITGQIITNARFNYEDKDSYSVTVSVTDNNGGTDVINVSISVSDENDKPVFTDGFFSSRSVAENLAIGATVGDPVDATDEDNDTLEYGLSGPNADSFNIDTNSGQITTKEILNHEEISTYSVIVNVNDGRGGKNGTYLTITVGDVNDAPVFDEGDRALRAIIESAASGTNVGHAVSATDEDGDTLEYSLSGTDANSFTLDTSNGQLTTNTTLDYDVQSFYEVTISVTDNNGGTDTITVEIDVLEFYLDKEEFFEVYYAIKIENDHLEVQLYTVRGYGYDGDDPIYVDNYYKFENGSSFQTSTGLSSLFEDASDLKSIEVWKRVYSEESGFTHASTRESLKDTTADAVRKTIYQTICNAAHNDGTWTGDTRGITYPEIDNNTSDDILTVEDLLLYLDDDDCDPTN